MQFMSNHPILSLAWVGLFIAVVVLTVKGWLSKVKAVSVSDAIKMINNEDAAVVDIRNAGLFKQGHITGAHNILPVDIKNGSLHAINKYKNHPVIVVCDHGLSASKPAADLIKAGYEQVYVLKEGISGWNSNNLPLVKGHK